MAIWYILWSFLTFSRVGKFYQEKSGNPAPKWTDYFGFFTAVVCYTYWPLIFLAAVPNIGPCFRQYPILRP
jgi:hypothetical protein